MCVVIPCFNDGSTVRDAVTSSLAQAPGDLVVVDDGSTDPQTLVVLDGLRETGIRVIRQPNAGPAAARTRGIAETTEPYVMHLDADDMIAPGALHLMASALDGDESLSIAWGDIERLGRGGYLRYPKGRSLDPWRITFVNELVSQSMVRRTALEAVGGWPHHDLYEDWDLWMEMAERGFRGRNVGEVTIYYRVGEPGLYQNALPHHGATVKRMRHRHAGLFSRRTEARRSAAAGRALKVLWTAIDAVPMPGTLKRYLLFGALVLAEPSRRRRRRPPRSSG